MPSSHLNPDLPTRKPESAPVVPEDGEFINREFSWLEFDRRVLAQAGDPSTPLLERVRFLSICTSNLDEFFMKRVGGLKRQVLAGVVPLSIDRLTPAKQLSIIRETVEEMIVAQARCFTEQIRPGLTEEGIHLLNWDRLTPAEQESANQYFQESVFPVVTPMAVDPGHPFPLLSNLSLSLGVKLAHPESDEPLFARVKVPETTLPTWLRLPTESRTTYRFVSLVDVIRHNLDSLFPGMTVLSVTPFRVTRNADIERDEEDAEDLLEMIEQELRERRFARVVRLEHGPHADPWTLSFVMHELDLNDQDVYELPGEIDYTDLNPIADLEIPDLRYPPWSPVTPPRLADEDVDLFSVIRSGDLLVHHPYESFSESVERFIRVAADDPRVVAVKLTLYRIGESRSLMDSLIRAAESGKQVICMVELKARFDEQRNIYWAHLLEQAGVHVFYGMVGLKTHTKLALVVRREHDGFRSYAHVGTGNYNVQTARLYTDIGFFSARPSLTRELIELFHYLTGRSLKRDYEHLLVAPLNMRQRFLDLIENEIACASRGEPSGIVAKMNQLEDRRIIRALYRASQAGVPVELLVRGFCCLRPQVPGLSENIRVTALIGRFLEHSRIYYFRNGEQNPLDGLFFIGSADWMYRNLNRRVELITPVEDLGCRARLWQILEVVQADQRHSWDLQADGSYTPRSHEPNSVDPGAHKLLMDAARRSVHRDDEAEYEGEYE